ncbi:hypothetical protein ES708_31607 [subsurface metagenome]
MIVVADASPLISFAIIDKLDLLSEIFDEIIVPKAVYNEISIAGKPFSIALERFANDKVVEVKNKIAVNILLNKLDIGEAEAIALALEKNIDDILLDDYKARITAKINGLYPIGTIGTLLQAKKVGLISNVKPLLNKLITNKVRIGSALYEKALELAKENK